MVSPTRIIRRKKVEDSFDKMKKKTLVDSKKMDQNNPKKPQKNRNTYKKRNIKSSYSQSNSFLYLASVYFFV
jgi:hypothetical protein